MKAKQRLLSLLLCGAMLFSLCPTTALAENATGLPDSTKFATVEELKSFNTNDNDGTSNPAKVYFGNNNQQWWIAGSQGENKLTLFAASPLATEVQFNSSKSNGTYDGKTVNANHYGASNIKGIVNGLETSHFSDKEQKLMNDTTVYTKDKLNGNTYSTTDKLYLAYGDNNDNQYITVGTNKADSLNGGLRIDKGYWGNAGIFWLRAPDLFDSDIALVAWPDRSSVFRSTVDSPYVLVPAFELDLSSVIFASATSAASSDGKLSVNDAFTLRHQSQADIGAATISQSKGNIAVTDVINENTYLVVQNSDGAWSKKVSSNDLVFAGDMDSSLTSFENCKVWLETTSENITYAKEATQGSGYNVKVNVGESLTVSSGNTLQTNVSGDITEITIKANDGYFLPDDYISNLQGKLKELGLEATETGNGFTISGTPNADVNITLPAANARTYTISITGDGNFAERHIDYTDAPDAATFTITNDGNSQVTGLSASLSGSGFILAQPAKTTLDPNDTTTFTAQPDTNFNFGAGTHTANVEITGNNGAKASVGLTFEVTAHNWDSAWTHSNTHHWHECTVTGCNITENSKKGSYHEHNFNGGNSCADCLFSTTDAETPNITGPQGGTYNVGDTVTLSVAASVSDGGTFSYQWYSNTTNSNQGGTDISGATNEKYTPPTTAAGTTYYYCVVTNTNNSATGQKTATATSNTAEIIVKANVTPPAHSHSWASDWTHNDTHHWHECTAGSCPTTDNRLKKGYGEHVYDDDTDEYCNTCNRKRIVTPTQPTEYTVTVNGSYAIVSGGGSYKATATVFIDAGDRSGYSFDGWTSSDGISFADAGSSSTTFTMPEKNVTVTANWKEDTPPQPTEYTITFDGNGGETPTAQITTGGKLTSLPQSTRSSHSFSGWYTAVTGGSKITLDTVFTADTTVYAHWTYNGGGGWDYTPPTYISRTLSKDGVTVTGSSIHRYATLTVDKDRLHNSGDCDSCEQIREWQGQSRVISIYDVALSHSFRGTVTITFPVSSENNGKTLTVAHCLKNKLETYDVTVSNGKVTVTVNSLSPFAILDNSKDEPGKENPDTGVTNPFTDVWETSWFFNDVMFVYERGLMAGTSATTFSPGSNTTRAQLAVIFYRMEGSPKVEGRNGFTDVEYGPGTAWYYDAVTWAKQSGVVSGYGNGTFGPGNPITREQLAAIFYRYAQYKGYDVTAAGNLDRFTDKEKVSPWAKEALTWAVSSGIVNGTGSSQLSPQGTATRAQIAAMLHRFVDWYEQQDERRSATTTR